MFYLSMQTTNALSNVLDCYNSIEKIKNKKGKVTPIITDDSNQIITDDSNQINSGEENC
jgi:hypothetical protein